jgi:hypothetical protein
MYSFKRDPNVDGRLTQATVEVRVPTHAPLTELCEEFTAFLRGCGFYFDGEVTVLYDTPAITQPIAVESDLDAAIETVVGTLTDSEMELIGYIRARLFGGDV